jgi:Na+/H+ antiporter
MIFAIIVLILAWSLAQTTEMLQTANYLVSILGEFLPVPLIPTVIFLLSATTAFAIGSSWGTMGIFYPIVFPLAWQIMFLNGVADMEHIHIIYSSMACMICGAVWWRSLFSHIRYHNHVFHGIWLAITLIMSSLLFLIALSVGNNPIAFRNCASRILVFLPQL